MNIDRRRGRWAIYDPATGQILKIFEGPVGDLRANMGDGDREKGRAVAALPLAASTVSGKTHRVVKGALTRISPDSR